MDKTYSTNLTSTDQPMTSSLTTNTSMVTNSQPITAPHTTNILEKQNIQPMPGMNINILENLNPDRLSKILPQVKTENGKKPKGRADAITTMFVCEYCNKVFKRKDHLNRHRSKIHQSTKPADPSQQIKIQTNDGTNTVVSVGNQSNGKSQPDNPALVGSQVEAVYNNYIKGCLFVTFQLLNIDFSIFYILA